MPNRTATFVSAVVAASLASLALITESHSVTQAPENCLSRPKGAPPQGGHWYYRVDRATKRHCWYVGDAREKVARASSNPSSAKPPPPQNELAAPTTLADARAEMLTPRPQTEPSIDVGAAQRMPSETADGATKESNQNASADGANLLREAFASRRPDQSGAPASSILAPANAVPTAQPNSKTAPVAPAIQLAAADSSSQTRNGSIQMLLLVIVGALAVAGIMGSVIFRFGSTRTAGRSDRRRAIWDPVDTDRRRTSPVYPRADASTRREASGSNDRIAEMLTRLSRSTAG